jgi:hypothetical protein
MQKAKGIYTDLRRQFKTKSNQNPKDAPPTFTKNPDRCKCEASPLHAVPKVVCVEEAIEFRIQIDDIDASLCGIPNNSTRKVASVMVLFSIDSQTAVNTEFQSGHILSVSLSLRIVVYGCKTYTTSSSALFSTLSNSSPCSSNLCNCFLRV